MKLNVNAKRNIESNQGKKEQRMGPSNKAGLGTHVQTLITGEREKNT